MNMREKRYSLWMPEDDSYQIMLEQPYALSIEWPREEGNLIDYLYNYDDSYSKQEIQQILSQAITGDGPWVISQIYVNWRHDVTFHFKNPALEAEAERLYELGESKAASKLNPYSDLSLAATAPFWETSAPKDVRRPPMRMTLTCGVSPSGEPAFKTVFVVGEDYRGVTVEEYDGSDSCVRKLSYKEDVLIKDLGYNINIVEVTEYFSW